LTEPAQAWRPLAALAALVLAPAAAALIGSTSGRPLHLNLGPGDSPYVSGFSARYEIDDKVATHWTSYDAVLRLPVALEGGGTLAYRYARVLPETAEVQVEFEDRLVDRFSCRGGLFETRRVPVAGSTGPARVHFKIDSHDRQRLGLRMDWLRLTPAAGARLRLHGAARWRPAALVAAAAFLLRLAGWSLGTTVLLAAPLAGAALVGLLLDPWLTHRLATGVPETLLLLGLPAVLLGRRAVERGRATPYALRALTALAGAAFLLRAAAVNHPAFYYPDLRTHARLVEFIAEGGFDFFVQPSKYIAAHGVWLTEAHGKRYAFPYSPAFHLPFLLLPFDYDARVTAMKLLAAALSVVPIVLLWALARRLGATVLGAPLLLLVPTYVSRLSFAFLPALLGHAVDMAFVFWLSGRLDAIPREKKAFATGVLFVCACQLAYVSGVINISLFVGVLALLVSLQPPAGPRRGAAVLAMGLLASLLSLALYYRDFLPMLFDVVSRIGGAAAAPSRYPVQPFLTVAAARTHDFFGAVYPVLALAGLPLLLTRAPAAGRSLLLAWGTTYFLLLLGRAKVPDLFLHGHETLLVTPLVCLASGEALVALWQAGRIGRVAAASALLFLAYQGLRLQWQALAAQLLNAL
jgi:hypothetical protein